MGWRSYVAIGDSFTEGMDDPYPDGTLFRGWADLVAERLSADEPGLGYANLAVRGRLFDRIVDEQVPVALRLAPDLVSFAAGGNDALRRNFDGPALVARFGEVVRALRAGGADVVVFRFADVTRRLPGRRLILPRVEALNAAVGEVADRYGARLVDLWADEAFHGPLLWSVDRLHLNRYGHRRVAAHVLTALDVKPDPQWWELPDAGPALTWASRRAADARWAKTHLAPWVHRRLTGRSSGDLVTAKRPDLTPVVPVLD
jgi:lysophospholipase L1-like esterase